MRSTIKLNKTWLIGNEQIFSNTLKICTYNSARRNPVLNKMFFNYEQVQIYEFSSLSAFVGKFFYERALIYLFEYEQDSTYDR